MKVDLSGNMLDLNKQPVMRTKENGEKTDEPVPVKVIITNALLAAFEDERELSGEDKYKRFKLADRINSAEGEVEISGEELALVKKMVGKGYNVLAVGHIYNLLESLESKKS